MSSQHDKLERLQIAALEREETKAEAFHEYASEHNATMEKQQLEHEADERKASHERAHSDG